MDRISVRLDDRRARAAPASARRARRSATRDHSPMYIDGAYCACSVPIASSASGIDDRAPLQQALAREQRAVELPLGQDHTEKRSTRARVARRVADAQRERVAAARGRGRSSRRGGERCGRLEAGAARSVAVTVRLGDREPQRQPCDGRRAARAVGERRRSGRAASRAATIGACTSARRGVARSGASVAVAVGRAGAAGDGRSASRPESRSASACGRLGRRGRLRRHGRRRVGAASPPRRSGAARASTAAGRCRPSPARSPPPPPARTSHATARPTSADVSRSSRPPKPGDGRAVERPGEAVPLRVPAPGARVALDEPAGLRGAERPAAATVFTGADGAAVDGEPHVVVDPAAPLEVAAHVQRAAVGVERERVDVAAHAADGLPRQQRAGLHVPRRQRPRADHVLRELATRPSRSGRRRAVTNDARVPSPAADRRRRRRRTRAGRAGTAVLEVAELAAHVQHAAVRRELDVRHAPVERRVERQHGAGGDDRPRPARAAGRR